MKPTKVAIFDFDGTLGDSAHLIQTLYKEEALTRSWPELTPEAYLELRKGSIRQAMKWVGIRSWQVPGLLRSGRRRFSALSLEVELFPGVVPMIKRLHKTGWKLYILSSNDPATIQTVLAANDIAQYMQVLNRTGLFGKARIIVGLMQLNGYQREHVWMIGDEVRDIEAGKKAGVRTIGVTWGLQHESVLELIRPDLLAHKLADIEKALKQA